MPAKCYGPFYAIWQPCQVSTLLAKALVYRMSHEWRSPVQVLAGMCICFSTLAHASGSMMWWLVLVGNEPWQWSSLFSIRFEFLDGLLWHFRQSQGLSRAFIGIFKRDSVPANAADCVVVGCGPLKRMTWIVDGFSEDWTFSVCEQDENVRSPSGPMYFCHINMYGNQKKFPTTSTWFFSLIFISGAELWWKAM